MKVAQMAQPKLVTPAEMQDGQIGIIRKWFDNSGIGLIVQKYDDMLIALGKGDGLSYPKGGDSTNPKCQIEILPPGTLLEI